MTGGPVFALPRISYTYAEASEHTGISVATLKAAVSAGLIEAHWVGEKASKPVIAAEELHAYVMSLPTTKGGDK